VLSQVVCHRGDATKPGTNEEQVKNCIILRV
jgi:hypothetical protein